MCASQTPAIWGYINIANIYSFVNAKFNSDTPGIGVFFVGGLRNMFRVFDWNKIGVELELLQQNVGLIDKNSW